MLHLYIVKIVLHKKNIEKRKIFMEKYHEKNGTHKFFVKNTSINVLELLIVIGFWKMI